MSASKTVVVGVIAFALGAIGARIAPVAAQQAGASVTMKAGTGTVTFRNTSSTNRVFIVGLGEKAVAPVRLSRETLEATISTAGIQEFLVLEVIRRSLVKEGVMNPCNPAADCPVPPLPPPLPPLLHFLELKPELKIKTP